MSSNTKSWLKAVVSWFNDAAGEGVVRANGKNYYVHYSAIKSKRKRKSLSNKQKVKIRVMDDGFAQHVTELMVGA